MGRCKIWGTDFSGMTPGEFERRVLKRFLVHLLRDGPAIDVGNGRHVRREARFQAEGREGRKKRLRKFREKKGKAHFSPVEQKLLGGLEGSSVYSNGYSSIFQPKPRGKRSRNISETKRLYVAALVYKKLCPERDSLEFVEVQTAYKNSNPRALEMRLRAFRARTHREW